MYKHLMIFVDIKMILMNRLLDYFELINFKLKLNSIIINGFELNRIIDTYNLSLGITNGNLHYVHQVSTYAYLIPILNDSNINEFIIFIRTFSLTLVYHKSERHWDL